MKGLSISKPWVHLLAWGLLFIVLVNMFFNRVGWVDAMIAALFFLGVQGSVFYLNLYVLFPRLLEKKRYLYYALSVIVVILLAVFMLHLIERYHVHAHLHERISAQGAPKEIVIPKRMHRAHRTHMVLHGVSTFGVLFLSTLIGSINVGRKQERERVELENKMLEAESKFLKSQINPHFLFNALNNIYSLAQTRSQYTSTYIHKLSQMLRYVLYDSNVSRVRLAKEIGYIQGFVELQKLRSEHPEGIAIEADDVDPELEIVPMLLIPFIENAFKHGNPEEIDGWVRIGLSSEARVLNFRVENSKGTERRQKDGTGGIGLENVKKRLELNYKGNYSLDIKDESDRFLVHLTIELHDDRVSHSG